MNLLGKINLKKLVKQHIETLYDYGATTLNPNLPRKVSFSDKFTFLFLPLILSAIFLSFDVYFKTEKYVDIAIKSLSLFTGLLFSLLVLVFNLGKKENEDRDKSSKKEGLSAIEEQRNELKLRIIKELFSNIAFAVLIALVCIIAILLTQFHFGGILIYLKNNIAYQYIKILREIYKYISNGLALAFIFEFCFVIFMILKRFGILFNKEFER